MTPVLLVEDDPIIARLSRALLQREGWESEWVENGREAMEILSSRRYPLVLLDLGLPDVDGLGVVIWLRHFEKQRGLPRSRVVVLSANDVRFTKALDVDGVLQKPLRMGELKRVLHPYGATP